MARRSRLRPALLALVSALLGAAALASGGAASSPDCAEFAAQADAQARFAELGGAPGHAVGDLDRDRDGIACEGLHGPYAAYATLGYNREGGFLYGSAAMPAAPRAGEGFPCLRGNRKGPLGPRRLRVYRALPGRDRAIAGRVRTGADPVAGRLLWKVPRPALAPGRYYVVFEAAIRSSPYGRNPCPGFRSREVSLPAPRLSR
jgi:hypothetical protein